jgi:hypothetical protein
MASLRNLCLLVLLFTSAFVLSGCRSRSNDFTPYVVRLYLEESRSLPLSHITDMVLPVSGSIITVNARPIFAEWDFINAHVVNTEFGLALILHFTADASTDLFRTSVANQGRRLVITVNGVPIGARLIERPIQDGQILFFPEMEESDIPELGRGIARTAIEIQERLRKSSRW